MNEEDKIKLQAEARIRRKQELDNIKFIMDTPQGRQFMIRLLSDAKIFSPCFVSDSHSRTFYNEGRREFALKYFSDVLHFPELYSKMMNENKPKTEDGKNGSATN